MSVSNEQLVALYQSTENERSRKIILSKIFSQKPTNEELVRLYKISNNDNNKILLNIIIKKIYSKNYGLIHSIFEYYIKKFGKLFYTYQKDLTQEIKIKLLEALLSFNIEKGTKFSSYFTNIAHKHIHTCMRDKYKKYAMEIPSGGEESVSIKIYNSYDMVEYDNLFSNIDDDIENIFICDNINICIDKIKFKTKKHEIIFKYRHGLNELKRKMTCKQVAEIVGLTQQRVDIICKKYEAKLKEIILEEVNNGNFDISDFGLEDLKV